MYSHSGNQWFDILDSCCVGTFLKTVATRVEAEKIVNAGKHNAQNLE